MNTNSRNINGWARFGLIADIVIILITVCYFVIPYLLSGSAQIVGSQITALIKPNGFTLAILAAALYLLPNKIPSQILSVVAVFWFSYNSYIFANGYLHHQESASPGLVVPTTASIFLELQTAQTDSHYSTDSYNIRYYKVPITGIKKDAEVESFNEDFKDSYSEPSADERQVFGYIPFVYAGNQGYISKNTSTVPSTTSFTLTWNDSGTKLEILFSNIPISAHNYKDAIQVLSTMVRVPGESAKQQK